MNATVIQFPRSRMVRERTCSKKELALALGRSARWVQMQVNENDMPHERTPSNELRFTLSLVREWLGEEAAS